MDGISVVQQFVGWKRSPRSVTHVCNYVLGEFAGKGISEKAPCRRNRGKVTTGHEN